MNRSDILALGDAILTGIGPQATSAQRTAAARALGLLEHEATKHLPAEQSPEHRTPEAA